MKVLTESQEILKTDSVTFRADFTPATLEAQSQQRRGTEYGDFLLGY